MEAPRTPDEMRRVCREVGGVAQMVNCLAGGLTPVLPPSELEEIGFRLAAYPLDLINASIVGMRAALATLKAEGMPPPEGTLPFAELQRVVGFPEYYEEEARYRVEGPPAGHEER